MGKCGTCKHCSMFIVSFAPDFYKSKLRENRYLLFLTENYAALEILRHYVVGTSPDVSMGEKRRLGEMEPFILFGSSFPKDKEYTQVHLIILCGHWYMTTIRMGMKLGKG